VTFLAITHGSLDDLVQGFLFASEQEAAIGKVFIIGDDEKSDSPCFACREKLALNW
jgi:hypothetical protein